MKKALFILVILSLLSGCVRYSNGKPVQSTEDKQTKEQTAKKETAQPEEKKNNDQQALKDKQAADDLKAYFGEGFSDASWYRLITDYRVSGENVIIKTSVANSAVGKAAIKGIDSTVWGFTNMKDSKYKFKSVLIDDRDGNPILLVNNPLN
jgi:hypothetical protein